MKKSKYQLIMPAITGICAVIWIVKCVKDFTVRTPGAVDGWNAVLAVGWSAACILNLYAYFKNRKE